MPNRRSDIPTILVIGDDMELRGVLAERLRGEGYLVLEADDGTDAITVVRTHSRAIHLLIDLSLKDTMLANTVKGYRPKIQALYLTKDLPLQLVLEKVRAFFNESQESKARARAAGGN